MKLFDILNESDASEEAKKKGLDYLSFGRYGKDGKVTHKVVNGKLQPVIKQTNPEKFAVKAHGNQMYGSKPYLYHLKKVNELVIKYGGSKEEQIIAFLHDVLEDTPVTKEELSKKFGSKIAHIVDLLSNKSSKEETFKRIRTSREAVFVKLCDRLANVSEGTKNNKYRKEQSLFKQILYRPGEFDNLWREIESKLQVNGN